MASTVQGPVDPTQCSYWIELDTSSSDGAHSIESPTPSKPPSNNRFSFIPEEISLSSALRQGYFEIALSLAEQGSFSTDPSELHEALRLAALLGQTRVVQEVFRRTVVSKRIVEDLVVLAASRNKQSILYLLKNQRLSARGLLMAMKQAQPESCKWFLLKFFTPYMKQAEDPSELITVLNAKGADAAVQYFDSERFKGVSLQDRLKVAILEDQTEMIINVLEVAEISQTMRDYLAILAAWKNRVGVLEKVFEQPVSERALVLAVLMIESAEVRNYLWEKLEDVSNLTLLNG